MFACLCHRAVETQTEKEKRSNAGYGSGSGASSSTTGRDEITEVFNEASLERIKVMRAAYISVHNDRRQEARIGLYESVFYAIDTAEYTDYIPKTKKRRNSLNLPFLNRVGSVDGYSTIARP